MPTSRLASKEGIDGETVDVGSGELTSVRQVVEQLVDIIEPAVQPGFGGVKDRPLERVRVADTGYAMELTGWSPRTTLQEGLKKTVDWYRINTNSPVDKT